MVIFLFLYLAALSAVVAGVVGLLCQRRTPAKLFGALCYTDLSLVSGGGIFPFLLFATLFTASSGLAGCHLGRRLSKRDRI